MTLALPARNERELFEANRAFYEGLWSGTKLIAPERFNTWPLVGDLVSHAARRLEVAPGLRPRLPIGGTHFADISTAALSQLSRRGGRVSLASVMSLPYDDASFDLVAALDIIEHVEDDGRALAELSRVSAPGAAVLIAVPLHPDKWIAFDDFVGHCRRYTPDELLAKLRRHGFKIEQSAAYGMQPKSSKLLDVGMWFLTHRREHALWCYNHLFMPLGLKFEKKLQLVPGVVDLHAIDEVLLVCRRA